jgi:DNA-binding SARP family transcriptional activator
VSIISNDGYRSAVRIPLSMNTLQIELLGHFHLTYAGAPITVLQQVRLQSLLAYLLLHRHSPQPRQHLAFLFWPDSSEAQAYSNLRSALHTLRHTLPEADRFLHVDAKVVQWRGDAPYTLDVVQFEHHLAEAELSAQLNDTARVRAHLDAAIELYGGDLLSAYYDNRRWSQESSGILILSVRRDLQSCESRTNHEIVLPNHTV